MMPRMLRPLLFALALSAGALACVGAPRPRVDVVGVSRAPARVAAPLGLVVEIHNPMPHALVLSGFDYRFHAENWFRASGSLPLAREVPAYSTAVVEIPVRGTLVAPAASGAGVRYQLDGNLRAVEGAALVNWGVSARGRVSPDAGGQVVIRAPAAARR